MGIVRSYWEQAGKMKIGRPRKFETAQDLWEAACEYFQWIDENPFMRLEQKRGNTNIKFDGVNPDEFEKPSSLVEIPTQRPYTLTGLCVFLNVNTRYFRDLKTRHETKNEFEKTEEDDNFSTVITRIEQIIYTNKFEGAAVNMFNSNIIARDLGLRDKQDVTTRSVGADVEREDDYI